MKRKIVQSLVTVAIIIGICSVIWGCKSSTSPEDPGPPAIRQLANPLPADGATKVFRNTTLSWTLQNPKGSPVTHSVFVFSDSTLTHQVAGAANLSVSSYSFPSTLPFNTKYFWYVVSKDGNDTVKGPVWSFTTIRQANFRPYTGEGADNNCIYDTTSHVITVTSMIYNDARIEIVANFRVGLFLSNDSLITPSDALLGYATFPGLDSNIIGGIGGQLDLDDYGLPANTFRIGFYVDYENKVAESDETDNAFLYPTIIKYP